MMYIKSAACISPQETLGGGLFSGNLIGPIENRFRILEPEYKNYVSPLLLRRMSGLMKTALTASFICIESGGVKDCLYGIIVGTGLGNVEYLEDFLFSMLENDENSLSPTSFMQSTNNMIASQIGMVLKCNSYNMTYSQGAHSFEWTLMDALSYLLNETKESNILVGGLDVNTLRQNIVYGRAGYWKDELSPNEDLLTSKTEGAVPGEGASFLVLTNKETIEGIRIDWVEVYQKSESDSESIPLDWIDETVKSHGNIPATVMLGINGDVKHDGVYHELINNWTNTSFLYYKHLCGEYFTASAFAVWLSFELLKMGSVPGFLKVGDGMESEFKEVLIVNQHRSSSYSLIKLSKTK